ncbi:MAG: HNH endonuclease [Elusimicrobia bacterium]|nr:HNH endonuclease [Elusimicrobiota bacterium]
MSKSISDLIMEYFKKHSNQDLEHGPVVDWVEKQYLGQYNKKPRDTWRGIRKLHQEGILIKVKKGIYRYDPKYIKKVELFEFPPDIKEAIFKRDNYKCVACGRSREDGVEICADHRIPKDCGGINTINNGQTLCMRCNLLKKNYGQTEMGKRLFIKIYEDSVKKNEEKMINFCKDVFDVYDKHQINGHISRPNGQK